MRTFKWKYGKDRKIFREQFNEKVEKEDIEAEPTKEDSVYMSDLLQEVYLCQQMEKLCVHREEYQEKFEEYGRNLLEADKTLGNFVSYGKQCLRHIERSKYVGEDKQDLVTLVDELIDDIRRRRYFDSLYIRERYHVLYEVDSLREVMEDLEEKMQYYRRMPYYLFEKLVAVVDEGYSYRRKMVRIAQHVHQYAPRDIDTKLTCQMVLNDQMYDQYIDVASRKMTKYISSEVSQLLASSPTEDGVFLQSIDNMKKYVNSCDANGGRRFRHYSKEKGCYGLLNFNHVDIFSFSGPFDIEDSNILNYVQFDPDKQRSNADLKVKVKKLQKDLFPFAQRAILNKDVKRHFYTKETDKMIPRKGESVERAMARNNDPAYKTKMLGDFSCCERKMFSYIKKGELCSQGYMFARHKPCDKCKPAIHYFKRKHGRLRIFYCGDNEILEWRSNEDE